MKQKTDKIIKKIKEAKGCFFKKEIQKMDKLLARLRKKKTKNYRNQK